MIQSGGLYAASLPFNWAKMSAGEQRMYLCAAYEVLAHLEGIVGLTEKHLSDETTSGNKELQDHFNAIQHVAKMSCSHLHAQIDLCKKEVTIFSDEEKKIKDVHTEHCCAKHGCKYGDNDRCTVESGRAPQSFPCEWCSDIWENHYDGD